jgi:aspartokinase-like uncharacterized kinase
MQVVKLGGSLSHSQALVNCLYAIAGNSQVKTVIVPGGGDFANQVRLAQQRWRFNDEIAHAMAILAMQQMALLFKGLQPAFILASSISAIEQALAAQVPIIWSPCIEQLNQANIKASWQITSDSLAAWLAQELNADQLQVVKAATIETQNLAQLAWTGVIDEAFASFVTSASFSFHIVNHRHFYAQQLADR